MPDNLLVNRNGQTHQVDMANTASIQDTDLLLVNRDGTTYTVAGSEISRGAFSEVLINPLSIIPDPTVQTITATADIPKVGSSVPADVLWQWYEYESATGDSGKRLLQETTNREITDSLILQSGSQGKYIGCSVTYLAVTVNETLRCSVGTPSTPVANMNSLRNDYNRTTYLTGGKTFSTSPTSLTISCWINYNF